MRTCILALVVFVSASHCSASEAEETDYELMRLFAETFEQIDSNYVRDVDRRELMEAAIRGMLGHLDQYSAYVPPRDLRRFNQIVEQEFGGIGVTVNYRQGSLVVVSPLPGTPAYRAGIRAGDRITAIEGETTRSIRLSQAVKKLQGPVGRPVTISVLHEGEEEPEEVRLVRQLIKAPTVRGNHYNEDAQWDFMLDEDDRIGLVRLTHFSRYSVSEVREAVQALIDRDVQGLIIDLRFNPGGLLDAAVKMADMFLEEGDIVSVRGRNVRDRSWSAKKSGTFPMFPMAVLVNKYSASASEVLSACLQDNERAVVIGERTWGKGSVQNVIQMEAGGSALKLTTASYHRPSGVNIHRFPEMTPTDEWGVTPDEGYAINYSGAEWRAWHADRDRRDVLRPAGHEQPEETVKPFNDVQLGKALSYIRSQLAEKAPTDAEPDAAESSEPADDSVEADTTAAKPDQS